MILYDELVYVFSGERVATRGYINLHTTFTDENMTKTLLVWYLVIDAHTSYNVLQGWPSLNLLGVVVSTPHPAMKFPSALGDIITVHED